MELESLWNTAQTDLEIKPELGSIGGIITKIIPLIFTIAGIILLLMLIAGGFQLILSSGDPKKAQSAQSKITSAIIGFLIIFVAYWIVQLVGNIFGIGSILNIFR